MVDKRHQFVVDWHVQYAYAANLLLRWFVLLAVVGSCTILVQYFACISAKSTETLLTVRTAVLSFIVTYALLIPVLIWDAIKMSHRFVGPIVKMKAVMRGIAEGKFQTIKLRKGDYWRDLADELNLLQEKLREREMMNWPSESKAGFHDEEIVACGD